MTDSPLALLGGPAIRSTPWPRWPQADPSTIDAVTEVLNSSRWALSGPNDGRVSYERRFAAAFAQLHGVDFCTPTTSGTAALTIAMQALGVGRGDEVLVPGLTWVACASSVAALGALPVLVDVDPETLAMSPVLAERAITERTAAIMLVHPFCSVGDLDAFTDLSARAGIPLIEDCAQAHGAHWDGRPVGTFGAAGCFSMQQSKLLTAGEGGAVITSDPALYRRLEQLRSDGRLFVDEPQAGLLELYEVAEVQGRNYCLSELQAAVLYDRLGLLTEQNELRAEHARHLAQGLVELDGVSVLEPDARVTRPAYYNLVLRFELSAFAGNSIDVIARALAAELATMVNPVYVPLNRHRLLCPDRVAPGNLTAAELAELDMSRFELPQAERARQSCATLTHPVLLDSKDGMDQVIEAIAKVQSQAGALTGQPQEATAWAF